MCIDNVDGCTHDIHVHIVDMNGVKVSAHRESEDSKNRQYISNFECENWVST